MSLKALDVLLWNINYLRIHLVAFQKWKRKSYLPALPSTLNICYDLSLQSSKLALILRKFPYGSDVHFDFWCGNILQGKTPLEALVGACAPAGVQSLLCVGASGDRSLGVMLVLLPAGCRELALPQPVHEDVNLCQFCAFFAHLLN